MPRRLGALATALAAVVLAVMVFTGDSSAGDRGEDLGARLRCPVCQSESVADSTSQTARDIQALIDEQIAAGSSDGEIIDFFVARYGEWIVLDAPAKGRTLVLWILPVVAAGGGIAVIASRRRRGASAVASEVIEEDRRDLARQVEMGELDDATASKLLSTYEAETKAPPPEPTSSRGSRVAAGVTVMAVAIGAVGFAVVRSSEARPVGGLLTGGIVDDGPRDLSNVTNEELEAVVAANPEVIPMRLALARRYFNEGDFSAALPHYLAILEREADPEALANVGWMVYLNDSPDTAAAYLERSLEAAPDYTQAQWFLANVRLFGLDDPEGAAPLLRQVLATNDVPDEVRREAESMLAEATAS